MNLHQEKPYVVTGDIQHTGLEWGPKDTCKDSDYRNVESHECHKASLDTQALVWEDITNFYHGESDGATDEISVMEMEEQPLVSGIEP
jgi:hypothetical protein